MEIRYTEEVKYRKNHVGQVTCVVEARSSDTDSWVFIAAFVSVFKARSWIESRRLDGRTVQFRVIEI